MGTHTSANTAYTMETKNNSVLFECLSKAPTNFQGSDLNSNRPEYEEFIGFHDIHIVTHSRREIIRPTDRMKL